MSPFSPLLLLLPLLLFSPLVCSQSPSCPFSSPAGSDVHHHGGDHVHHHHHDHDHGHHRDDEIQVRKLPEELAEEEDLALDGFDPHHHHEHEHDVEMSPIGLWAKAMGCSLLVSLASLICLIILPVICLKGRPSKAVVDSLAVFGAGAMLGDAFLHQLPHAFGGQHSHEHYISDLNEHHHGHGHEHSHSHSIQDLSVGIAILSGIVLFLLVEKVVRYVEEHSENGAHGFSHGHHHPHKIQQKLKDEDENHEPNQVPSDTKRTSTVDKVTEDELPGSDSACINGDKEHESLLRKHYSLSHLYGADMELWITTVRKATSQLAKILVLPTNLSLSFLVI